jgi:ATP-dependent Clp protease protease subunit
MNVLLAKHTGRSEEEVEKACSFDHYFDPQESIQFGLADKITDFGKFMEVSA